MLAVGVGVVGIRVFGVFRARDRVKTGRRVGLGKIIDIIYMPSTKIQPHNNSNNSNNTDQEHRLHWDEGRKNNNNNNKTTLCSCSYHFVVVMTQKISQARINRKGSQLGFAKVSDRERKVKQFRPFTREEKK
jgi:hypothetical protein